MSEDLTTIDNLANLPAMQMDDDFGGLTNSTNFLGRLQLYTKGNAVNKRLVQPGSFGIPVSKDEIIDLGEIIDVLPLARRAKAIDMSDEQAIVVNYDQQSDEFKRIQAKSGQKDSGCMYGVSFLVIERSTGRFLEFFCGSKSTRPEAGKIFPFLPVSEQQCELYKKKMEEAGKQYDPEKVQPHGPLPMSMKSKLVEKGTYSWHVPVVLPCSTPFNDLPEMEKIVAEVNKFLTEKDNGVETVKQEDTANRRTR